MEVYEVTSRFTIYSERLSGRRYRVFFRFALCPTRSGSCAIQQLTWSSAGGPARWSPSLVRVGWTRIPRVRLRFSSAQGLLSSGHPHAGTASRDGWEMVNSGISAAPACSALTTQDMDFIFCRCGLCFLFFSAKEGLGLAQGG